MHSTHRLSRRQALVLGGLGGLQALAPTAVRAQATFPNRPIQFIVAAPAGGPSDNAARMIADEMGKLLGQPMVVVNKPGSAGVIAAEATARAAQQRMQCDVDFKTLVALTGEVRQWQGQPCSG